MPPIDRIAEFSHELIELRHDLHAHPELGFEEKRTSEIVAAKLSSWGVEVHRGIGKTGVVGVLRNGTVGSRRIGLRADARFTAPEPELAAILGSRGAILGFTLADDVSAWDIERENPLYLPQSKVYAACCALGPVIVTPDELADPYRLEMTCTITRGAVTTFQGSVSTSRLHRKIETLIEYLLRANPVPTATVLLTGTGIIVTEEAALAPGDTVSIRVPEIGELSNQAAVVQ